MLEPRTSGIRLVAVAKPGGVRWLTRLAPARANAYAQAVLPVVAPIELALRPNVLANRVVGVATDPPTIRLEAWRAARARFRRDAAVLGARSEAILLADVRACYANIGPRSVRSALERLGCAPACASRVVETIQAFQDDGVPGLPIGPEPSAVLANAVLAHVDERLRVAGYRHLRWVDDVFVFAWGRTSIDRALEVLEEALADLGLGLAERKTRVVDDPADVGSVLDSPSGSPGRTVAASG